MTDKPTQLEACKNAADVRDTDLTATQSPRSRALGLTTIVELCHAATNRSHQGRGPDARPPSSRESDESAEAIFERG